MTWRQLALVGVTREQVRHRIRVHRLFRIYPKVYATVPQVYGKARYRAAVYACGRGAVLSHRSAADHDGLSLRAPAVIEVTVPRGNGCRPKGIRVHEARSLHPDEVTIVDGIPCTSWARTIVDCAGAATEREIDPMIERSTILRTFDLNEMRRALIRARGKRGSRTIHSLLARFSEVAPTRSELERLLLDLTRSLDIPDPIVNGIVRGYEVDFHWPDDKVIVEADGRATHDTPHGWERDRERDFELELNGWRVLRITWRMLTEQPQRVAQLLIARLSGEVRDSAAA